jgi:hypothetical protein
VLVWPFREFLEMFFLVAVVELVLEGALVYYASLEISDFLVTMLFLTVFLI